MALFILITKEANIICYNAALRACERASEWQQVLRLLNRVEAGTGVMSRLARS